MAKHFGDRVTVTTGTNPPSNVRPARIPWKDVTDALEYDQYQEERDAVIEENKRRLKEAEERRRQGYEY